MSKIRTVKPELFRHVHLFEAEKKYQLPLRLAFIGLFTCCDREGRFRWEPRPLKLDILPYDDIDFSKILDALWAAGFIKKYTAQGKSYGYIPSWHQHQSINKHEPISKLPNPQQCEHETTPYEQSIEMHMQHSALQKQTSAMSISKSATPEPLTLISMKSSAVTENFKINQQDTSNQKDLSPLLPEMHMQAHAMHMPAPEIQMPASLEVEVEMEMEVEREVELDVEKEMEYQGELGSKPNIVAPARRRSVGSAQIFQVFNFWKTTLNHPQALLDAKRQRLISQALQRGYSVAQLCDAISGCAKTPHNMGDNDRGQRYDGLHVILRDSDQIERFMRHHHNPPCPPNTSDKLLRENVNAGKNWLNKKIAGEKN